MVTPELLDFIRTGLASGMTKDQLLGMLLGEGGWNKEDVDEAFSKIDVTPHEDLPASGSHMDTDMTPKEDQKPSVKPTSGTQAQAAPPPATTAPTSEMITKDTPLPTFEEVKGVVASPPAIKGEELSVPQIEEKTAHNDVEEKTAGVKEDMKEVSQTKSPDPFIPPEEDFLGIFGFAQDEKAPSSSMSAPVQITKTSVIPPIHTERLLDLNVESNSPQQSSKKNNNILESPSPTPAPHQEKVAPLKFNFEKLRTETKEEQQTTTKEGLAQFLTQASEPQQKSVQIPPVSLPKETVSGTYTHLSHEALVQHAPPSKRTMASDLLLAGVTQGEEESSVIPSDTPKVPENEISVEIPPTPALEAEQRSVVVEKNLSPLVLKTDDDIKEKISHQSLIRQNSITPKNIQGDGVAKDRIRRLSFFAITGVVTLLVLGGIGYGVFRFFGSNIAESVNLAEKNFFALNAFGYNMSASTALHLSSLSGDSQADRDVNISAQASGGLLVGEAGYGDGVHIVQLKGGIQSGQTAWPTDVNMEVRIVGTTLYFHLISLPATSNLDPDLFRTYWIKVDLAEIAKELTLSGVLASSEGYGNFGGQDTKHTFNALLQQYSPLKGFSSDSSEEVNGIKADHFKFGVDPDKTLDLISELYHTYLSKDLVLDDEERVRFKDALGKIEGELWINPKDNTLLRVALHADLDDDIVGTHVKGKLSTDITLSDLNTPHTVETPSPQLTLEELRVQMDTYKTTREMRDRDQLKVENIKRLTLALDAYKTAKGKYPMMLKELYDSGVLASSTIPESTLRQFGYAAYISSSPISTATLCSATSKTCEFYHVGISVEEPESSLLKDDEDFKSIIDGSDDRGCVGEFNRGCYDVTSARASSVTDTTSSPKK